MTRADLEVFVSSKGRMVRRGAVSEKGSRILIEEEFIPFILKDLKVTSYRFEYGKGKLFSHVAGNNLGDNEVEKLIADPVRGSFVARNDFQGINGSAVNKIIAR
jgi:hypothetical protein